MTATIDDVTALLTAIGLLIGALSATAGRAAQCLSDIRRQNARLQSTATKTERRQLDGNAKIDRLSELLLDHITMTDARAGRIVTRLDSVDDRLTRLEENQE
ncbi:MAG: hypothetical protein DI609_01295 [Corynebacterium urealyticum]|uniref:Uncharacterized protein n=1 Tax=Corynebacterium urealyticum TaxID=43771 RepID=A0A2W5BFJ4_9CORY|nr:MAG: hypothetical protein DI609_01295 [Corynebacterium urealyticum]